MKIAICDDDETFLMYLHSLLEKWTKSNGSLISIYSFTNGDELLLAQQHESMDLIFLDVVMPLLNGIDTARELRNNHESVPIIFLTSSREYAVDSYEVQALNYLMKPIKEAALFHVLDNFLEASRKNEQAFVAKTASGFCRINISDVAWLEAQNKLVYVNFTNGSTLKICETFHKCMEIFSEDRGFFKCHRSYLVNLSCVREFTKNSLYIDKTIIPIARSCYAAFKEAYFQHIFL